MTWAWNMLCNLTAAHKQVNRKPLVYRAHINTSSKHLDSKSGTM